MLRGSRGLRELAVQNVCIPKEISCVEFSALRPSNGILMHWLACLEQSVRRLLLIRLCPRALHPHKQFLKIVPLKLKAL